MVGEWAAAGRNLTMMRRSKADATTCIKVVTQNRFRNVQPLINDWKMTMPIQPVKAPTTDVYVL